MVTTQILPKAVCVRSGLLRRRRAVIHRWEAAILDRGKTVVRFDRFRDRQAAERWCEEMRNYYLHARDYFQHFKLRGLAKRQEQQLRELLFRIQGNNLRVSLETMEPPT